MARRIAQQTRAWADAAGVELWSVHLPFGRGIDPSNPSEEQRALVVSSLSRVLEAYAPLRVKKLTIHASAEISKPIPVSEREYRIAAARKSLAELAPKAAAIKAQLALECLPRACLGNTSQEVLKLIDGVPAIGVNLDTGHLFKEKPEDFVRKLGSRIVTLHVEDYDAVEERHWLPGKGVINFPAVVRALESAGYPGPFIFECDGTPEEKIAAWNRIKKTVTEP